MWGVRPKSALWLTKLSDGLLFTLTRACCLNWRPNETKWSCKHLGNWNHVSYIQTLKGAIRISSLTVSGPSTAGAWQWMHCCQWTSIWLVSTFFHIVPTTFHPATCCFSGFWLVNALFFRCPATFCATFSILPYLSFFRQQVSSIGPVEDGSSYLCNIVSDSFNNFVFQC